ncbi:MAG: hypothetical protein HXS48_22675 [Theionarchaea archaeon]|nr:MAG: hypothetical protein AYK19_10285 [Theionarchaea archaeon DG-70-1]MBU7029757.1 hypothetical protein [Theionarchaea archaeon]
MAGAFVFAFALLYGVVGCAVSVGHAPILEHIVVVVSVSYLHNTRRLSINDGKVLIFCEQ